MTPELLGDVVCIKGTFSCPLLRYSTLTQRCLKDCGASSRTVDIPPKALPCFPRRIAYPRALFLPFISPLTAMMTLDGATANTDNTVTAVLTSRTHALSAHL